jgi:hypothetical protein
MRLGSRPPAAPETGAACSGDASGDECSLKGELPAVHSGCISLGPSGASASAIAVLTNCSALATGLGGAAFPLGPEVLSGAGGAAASGSGPGAAAGGGVAGGAGGAAETWEIVSSVCETAG